MKHINHEDPRWTDFALGELPEHEMNVLRRFAAKDADVQAALRETEELTALMREGFRSEVFELGESRREVIRKAGRAPAPETVISMQARRRDWLRPASIAAVAAGLVGCALWVMQQIPVEETGAAATSNSVSLSYRETVRRQILLGDVPQATRSTAAGVGVAVEARNEHFSVILPEVPREFIEQEYLALKALWDDNPEGFAEQVEAAAEKAELSLLSHIAAMADNPFISAEAKPQSVVPIASGTASYHVVERFVRGEMKLPPRGSVRIEELINHLSYSDDRGASVGGVKLSVEFASCPWDEDLALMGVLLQNDSDRVVASEADVILTMDPDFVKSYRLIGYAGREDPEVPANRAPSTGGLVSGRSNYVLYQIRLQEKEWRDSQKIMARVSLRAGIAAEELVVPVTRVPKEWVLASNNLKTAVALSSWGMVLRQSPFGGPLTHFDVGRMAREALQSVDATELKRREALQLILDSLPLFEVDAGS